MPCPLTAVDAEAVGAEIAEGGVVRGRRGHGAQQSAAQGRSRSTDEASQRVVDLVRRQSVPSVPLRGPVPLVAGRLVSVGIA